jgi:hypothetical protein
MYIVSTGTPSITRSCIQSECRHVARALQDCHMCERNEMSGKCQNGQKHIGMNRQFLPFHKQQKTLLITIILSSI